MVGTAVLIAVALIVGAAVGIAIFFGYRGGDE